jgi:hypothetical protein
MAGLKNRQTGVSDVKNHNKGQHVKGVILSPKSLLRNRFGPGSYYYRISVSKYIWLQVLDPAGPAQGFPLFIR